MMLIKTGWKILLLLLVIPFIPRSKQPSSQKEAVYHFKIAEKYFNSSEPTDVTDSLALYHYKKALSLSKEDDSVRWKSLVNTAVLYQSAQQFDLALPYLLISHQTAGKYIDSTDQRRFLPLIYTGNSYYKISMYDSSKFFYNKARELAQHHPGINGKERLYNTLGVVYFETGDYASSEIFFRKALQIIVAEKKVEPEFLVNYSNNLAATLRQEGKFEEALNIFRSLLQYGIHKDDLMINIASTLTDLHQYEEAKALIQNINSLKDGHLLARIFLGLNDTNSAKSAMDQYCKKKHDTTYKNIALSVHNKILGDIAHADNDHYQAIKFYHAAIQQLVPSFKDNDVKNNPGKFTGVIAAEELLEAMEKKAACWFDLSNNGTNKKEADESLETYLALHQLMDQLQSIYNTQQSRLLLNRYKHRIHVKPIEIAKRLYSKHRESKYLELIYLFDEKNKANVLLQGTFDNQLRKQKGIPPNLLNREQELKDQISVEIIRSREHTDSIQTKRTEQRINDLQVSLVELQETIDRHPSMQQIERIAEIRNVSNIQKQLQEGQLLLSYHVGDTSLTIIKIAESTIDIFESKLNNDLLREFIVQTRDPRSGDIAKIKKQGNLLYKQLLEPVGLSESIEELIIIPDDQLNELPFESLTDDEGNWLLEKFPVSYNYSASLLSFTTGKPGNRMGFAPFTKLPSQNFEALPASFDEISSLDSTYFDQYATKRRFLQSVEDAGLIHLATHAVANDSIPSASFIQFFPGKDSKLYEEEIYNLDLSNCSLLILSACRTAAGQLQMGEGLMSLSRAFRYAGCSNLVSSLWTSDDWSTSSILKDFHHEIESGIAYSLALQKARKAFLASTKGSRQQLPYYWANLRFIGDPAMNSRKNMQWIYVVVFLGIVSLALLLRKFKIFVTR